MVHQSSWCVFLGPTSSLSAALTSLWLDVPSLEWQIVELACNLYAKVSVALYDTLGASSVGERGYSMFSLGNLTLFALKNT